MGSNLESVAAGYYADQTHASEQRAVAERAITLLALATLRLAEHHRCQAQSLVAEARALCEVLAIPATLAMLRSLEANLAPSSGLPLTAPLSPRERDVLQVVAQGMTDAEVADQLSLSRRTITTHLTSIYAKLGVSSRTAAARVALEHGLI